MIKQRLVAVPITFVAMAMAYSAPPTTAVFCGAAALLALVVGQRADLDRVAQAALSTGAMVAAVFLARVTAAPHESAVMLSERTLLLGLPMLAVAAARACIARPVYGTKVTLLAALVALTAAGRVQTGWVYPTLSALALLSGLLAMRASDPARAPLRQLEARHYGGVAFGIAAAAGLAVFATWSLPRMHDALIARMMFRGGPRTGFSESMSLGDMQGMLEDDAVIMRVRGRAPELLRGIVLTKYQGRRWEGAPDAGDVEVVETPMAPDGPAIEIEHTGRPQQYFVPAGATVTAASSGFVNRLRYGVYRPTPSFATKRLWFRQGPAQVDPGPTLADLQLPRQLSPELASIIDEWGASAASPREAVGIIERRLLSDYRYSLSFQRPPNVDPVIDFLRTHKEGHCEYFASAMVLLARAAKVPARIAAGYRVMERSPFGYAIVRERHAHSWVEVWLDDHWETFDPTPASDADPALAARTPWFSALIDGARTAWEAVDDWIAKRSPFELTLALACLVGALVMVRALRNRRARVKTVTFEIPRELDELARALRRRGIDREPYETLGTLAMRVSRADQLADSTRSAVTRALERYERYRYGDEGDGGEALSGLRQAAALLR